MNNKLSKKARKLTPKLLAQEYAKCPSDKQLSLKYACSEAYIQQSRARYGIKTILNGIGRLGEVIVYKALKIRYNKAKIVDLNGSRDNHSPCNILLNDLRITVKTAKVFQKTAKKRRYAYWSWALADDGRKNKYSLCSYKKRIRNTTLLRKLYHKICDCVIFVALDEEEKVEFYLIIPADAIPEVNNITMYRNFKSKRDIWWSKNLDLSQVGHNIRPVKYLPKIAVCKKCGKKFSYVSMISKWCPECRKKKWKIYQRR